MKKRLNIVITALTIFTLTACGTITGSQPVSLVKPVSRVVKSSLVKTAETEYLTRSEALSLLKENLKNSTDIEKYAYGDGEKEGIMSRAEAIYLLINTYFSNALDKGSKLAEGIEFSDVKNGGNIKEVQNFTGEQASSKELAYMLEHQQDGVSHSLYKALAIAYDKGILEGKETRWNEGITKSELMEFIVRAEGEYENAGIVKNGYTEPEQIADEDTKT